MRCCIIPIAAHRPTRLRRTGTIPSTASIFLTQRGQVQGGRRPIKLVADVSHQWDDQGALIERVELFQRANQLQPFHADALVRRRRRRSPRARA
jgi:hypothetical protein